MKIANNRYYNKLLKHIVKDYTIAFSNAFMIQYFTTNQREKKALTIYLTSLYIKLFIMIFTVASPAAYTAASI